MCLLAHSPGSAWILESQLSWVSERLQIDASQHSCTHPQAHTSSWLGALMLATEKGART